MTMPITEPPTGDLTPPASQPDPTQGPNQPSGPTTFTAEDVERIRKEEKDKLYASQAARQKAFEEQQAELKALRESQQAREEAERKAAEQAAEAERKRQEAEMSAKDLIAARDTEWNERFNKMQADHEFQRASWEKEKEFAALREYTQQRVSAAVGAGEIAPELADYVSGNTQSEIDSSIEFAKSKTQQIAENIRTASEQARQQQLRGVAPTGYAPVGPTDQDSNQQISVEQLRNMSMQDWAKNRQQIIGASAASTQQGLFG